MAGHLAIEKAAKLGLKHVIWSIEIFHFFLNQESLKVIL
jgi:hypothetical protein